MRIFISYSHADRSVVKRITVGLERDGHKVFTDQKLRPGDIWQRRIQDELEQVDVLIFVISVNSFRSETVQKEFAAIALQEISNRERRIIPIRIDHSAVPSYLSDRQYLDLSDNFEVGLSRLRLNLQEATPASIAAAPRHAASTRESRSIQIAALRSALRHGRLTLMCGAGVSIQAGIPSWNDLLLRLLKRMMERISRDLELKLGDKEAAEFQKRQGGSSLILGKYLKNTLGKNFQSEVRDALYADSPKSSPLIESIVELSRPQRDSRPLDSIVTFNFDCLVEEQLDENRIASKPVYSDGTKHGSNQLPVYHVHGYLPRTGKIPQDVELVFSEDTYHSQFIDPFSWSNLIQLNKLTQNTCLFVGISLTDPNMRRLLDVAWRKNPDKKMQHYLIKRLPLSEGEDVLDKVSKLLEEQDANALGLNLIWIEEFSDLPAVVREIADMST